jgi:hypothetical protein
MKVSHGKYILRTATCVANETGSATLLIYGDEDTIHWVAQITQATSADSGFNLPREIVFEGPMWIFFNATTDASTTLRFTLGLEKVRDV